ncbi:hypothetical protein [Methanobrevibacter ruminantium]|uniref:hypothetical protein n=1 Tax=Methanobrevibacter ruminantium TaxID=83816 RepID=UPI002D806B2A|nr:hypothetical protein [Methanobrevibacter ruminantium]
MGQRDIYQCENCGFEFVQDYLNFYLNLKTGQIEDFMILMFTVDLDWNSPLKGDISTTYCGNCDKYINIYEIKSLSDNYDSEAAYYLLRLLLPKKIDHAKEKVQIYKKLEEIIKERNLEKINNFIKYNDYILNEIEPIETLEDIEYLDVEYYKEASIEELERIENTVYLVHLPNTDYNLDLNGEKVSMDVCPNCKSKIHEIDSEHPCPKCGGEILPSISMMMD